MVQPLDAKMSGFNQNNGSVTNCFCTTHNYSELRNDSIYNPMTDSHNLALIPNDWPEMPPEFNELSNRYLNGGQNAETSNQNTVYENKSLLNMTNIRSIVGTVKQNFKDNIMQSLNSIDENATTTPEQTVQPNKPDPPTTTNRNNDSNNLNDNLPNILTGNSFREIIDQLEWKRQTIDGQNFVFVPVAPINVASTFYDSQSPFMLPLVNSGARAASNASGAQRLTQENGLIPNQMANNLTASDQNLVIPPPAVNTPSLIASNVQNQNVFPNHVQTLPTSNIPPLMAINVQNQNIFPNQTQTLPTSNIMAVNVQKQNADVFVNQISLPFPTPRPFNTLNQVPNTQLNLHQAHWLSQPPIAQSQSQNHNPQQIPPQRAEIVTNTQSYTPDKQPSRWTAQSQQAEKLKPATNNNYKSSRWDPAISTNPRLKDSSAVFNEKQSHWSGETKQKDTHQQAIISLPHTNLPQVNNMCTPPPLDSPTFSSTSSRSNSPVNGNNGPVISNNAVNNTSPINPTDPCASNICSAPSHHKSDPRFKNPNRTYRNLVELKVPDWQAATAPAPALVEKRRQSANLSHAEEPKGKRKKVTYEEYKQKRNYNINEIQEPDPVTSDIIGPIMKSMDNQRHDMQVNTKAEIPTSSNAKVKIKVTENNEEDSNKPIDAALEKTESSVENPGDESVAAHDNLPNHKVTSKLNDSSVTNDEKNDDSDVTVDFELEDLETQKEKEARKQREVLAAKRNRIVISLKNDDANSVTAKPKKKMTPKVTPIRINLKKSTVVRRSTKDRGNVKAVNKLNKEQDIDEIVSISDEHQMAQAFDSSVEGSIDSSLETSNSQEPEKAEQEVAEPEKAEQEAAEPEKAEQKAPEPQIAEPDKEESQEISYETTVLCSTVTVCEGKPEDEKNEDLNQTASHQEIINDNEVETSNVQKDTSQSNVDNDQSYKEQELEPDNSEMNQSNGAPSADNVETVTTFELSNNDTNLAESSQNQPDSTEHCTIDDVLNHHFAKWNSTTPNAENVPDPQPVQSSNEQKDPKEPINLTENELKLTPENISDEQTLTSNKELLKDDGNFGILDENIEDYNIDVNELIQILENSLRSMDSEPVQKELEQTQEKLDSVDLINLDKNEPKFIIENTTDKQILMKNDELLRDDGHFGCINQHTEDDELIQIFGSSLRSMESELESEQSMTNKTKEDSPGNKPSPMNISPPPQELAGNALEPHNNPIILFNSPAKCPINAKTEALTHLKTTTKGCFVTIDRLEKIPKNTNTSMHAMNSDFKETCVICNSNESNLIDHYANEHVTFENYLSRMPPHMLQLIEQESNIGILNGPMVTGQCGFCEINQKLSRNDWAIHITKHTGEYIYYCDLCDVKTPIKKHGKCAVSVIIKISEAKFSDSHGITVFTCTLCKYTQIHEQKLIRHIEIEHGIENNVSDHYKQLFFLKFVRDNEKNEEVEEEQKEEVVNGNDTAESENSSSDKDKEQKSKAEGSSPDSKNAVELKDAKRRYSTIVLFPAIVISSDEEDDDADTKEDKAPENNEEPKKLAKKQGSDIFEISSDED